MTLPGFTAELSLYAVRASYYTGQAGAAASELVVPQSIAGGCFRVCREVCSKGNIDACADCLVECPPYPP